MVTIRVAPRGSLALYQPLLPALTGHLIKPYLPRAFPKSRHADIGLQDVFVAQLLTDDSGVDGIPIVVADRSPDAIVQDFQAAFKVPGAPNESDCGCSK